MREAERAVDAEVRAHFGPALDGFTYLPERLAVKEVGPIPDDIPHTPETLNAARREIAVLLKELGKLQTGGPVAYAWCADAAAEIAASALGVVGWSIGTEVHPAALGRVKAEVEQLLVCEKLAASEARAGDGDIPF